ncbi:hypothetical protein TNCV_4887111 [Trichonephila clavipes]|nr:hypothetical protein TNCV_4887111 [Trichonephila clavipes]
MPQNLLEHVSASYLLLRLVGYSHLGGRRRISSTSGLTSLEGRALFSFPRSYRPRRLTGSAIWRRGSVTAVLGIEPLVGLGVKRREEFGRRISSFQCQTSSFEVPSADFRVVLQDSLSLLGEVAHCAVQDVRGGNKQVGLLSAVLRILFSWFRSGVAELGALCFHWRYSGVAFGRGLVSVDFADTGAQNPAQLRLERVSSKGPDGNILNANLPASLGVTLFRLLSSEDLPLGKVLIHTLAFYAGLIYSHLNAGLNTICNMPQLTTACDNKKPCRRPGSVRRNSEEFLLEEIVLGHGAPRGNYHEIVEPSFDPELWLVSSQSESANAVTLIIVSQRRIIPKNKWTDGAPSIRPWPTCCQCMWM